MFVVRTLVLFIVLACLIHIFAILATPFFAEQKVWQRVVDRTQPRQLTALKNHKEVVSILGQADPSMAYAICHFSLENGPVSIVSEGPTSFWNVTLFNNNAEVIYSLNDDASKTNQLNLFIEQTIPISETTAGGAEEDAAFTRRDNTIPTPTPAPKIEEQEPADADINEEDGSVIKAFISANQVFVVFKIFKESQHHTKLIEEAFRAANCK